MTFKSVELQQPVLAYGHVAVNSCNANILTCSIGPPPLEVVNGLAMS